MIIDSRKPLAVKKIVAKNFSPHVFYPFNFGEKTVSSYVKMIVFVINRPCETANHVVFFKDY